MEAFAGAGAVDREAAPVEGADVRRAQLFGQLGHGWWRKTSTTKDTAGKSETRISKSETNSKSE